MRNGSEMYGQKRIRSVMLWNWFMMLCW